MNDLVTFLLLAAAALAGCGSTDPLAPFQTEFHQVGPPTARAYWYE